MKASVLLPAFLLLSSGLCAGDDFPQRGGESPDQPEVRTDQKLPALQEDERASEDLIDRIAQLRKEAIRAKRGGDADRAKEVWSEADRLENELQGRMAGDRAKRRSSRGDRDDPKAEELLRDIKEKTRTLAQEGKTKAKELANKAKELGAKAKELAKEGQQEKAEALKREAEEVRAKGEALAREYQEKAEKLRREAEERVEKRLRNEGVPEKPRVEAFNAKPPAPARLKGPVPPQRPGAPVPPPGLNGEAREDLRQEIDRLRSEVRELRDLLKRSLEEKPRGPEKEPKQSF